MRDGDKIEITEAASVPFQIRNDDVSFRRTDVLIQNLVGFGDMVQYVPYPRAYLSALGYADENNADRSHHWVRDGGNVSM